MLQPYGINIGLKEHSNRVTPKAYTPKSPSGPLPPDSGLTRLHICVSFEHDLIELEGPEKLLHNSFFQTHRIMDKENNSRNNDAAQARLRRKIILHDKHIFSSVGTDTRNQKNIDAEIVSKLSVMLDEYNVHAKSFKMAKERLKTKPIHDLKLVLISNRSKDGRIYNIPSILGVVALVVGDVDTGKTFVWKTLTSALRSQRQIVLTVASSGITSLLLPGGQTAHSKFKIHVPTFDDSICNIHQALDKSLRDIMRLGNESSTIFGGKVIAFGGDFCQILPIVPRGSQSDIVHSTINASYVWDHCEVLILTKNMHLQSSMDNLSASELSNFSQWILDIGDGKIFEPNDGFAIIEIPQELLISDFNDPIHGIVNSTYPNLDT
ncbi:hypothetical protein D0Y65_018218 [Glycine soja]|uniref:ATP-dependent DNA helicase n=1 Tax=Glycine soja TaxID=3848 RepID=A0A445JY66_GLYSO|nr:hypothetical protein D0Y65_018218 [Glycine soja]